MLEARARRVESALETVARIVETALDRRWNRARFEGTARWTHAIET